MLKAETPINTIQELASAKSSIKGTTLVTKYITPNENLQIAISDLTHEISEAKNIKSKHVHKAVTSALKSGINKLKTINTLPENGIVLCAGEIESCF